MIRNTELPLDICLTLQEEYEYFKTPVEVLELLIDIQETDDTTYERLTSLLSEMKESTNKESHIEALEKLEEEVMIIQKV